MMTFDYECIFCDSDFDTDYGVRCHLEEEHDWDELTARANEQFSRPGRVISCGNCRARFEDFDDFLHHGLSSCKFTLYYDRKMILVNTMKDALNRACEAAVNRPSGILRAAPDWEMASIGDVDVAVVSQISKQLILVCAAAPWDMNIPCVHMQKLEKLSEIEHEYTQRGFHCDIYSVEVGARGIVSKSVYEFLRDVAFSEEVINQIVLNVQKAIVRESQTILRPGNIF